MVISIAFTEMHTVGVSSSNKIKVNDTLISLNEIPFIRYKLGKYGDAEVEFIKRTKETLVGPVNLVEFNLSENILEEYNRVVAVENVAKFLYIPIDDYDIANGLKEETIEMLESTDGCFFDRYILKDNSTMIYAQAADRLCIEIENILGKSVVRWKDIGICGSPLSFRYDETPGRACLTAVQARKIMVNYADSDKIVVPSASHESMTTCGCIKFMVVTKDCPAPMSTRDSSKKAPKTPKESKEPKEPKEPKAPKLSGVRNINLDIF